MRGSGRSVAAMRLHWRGWRCPCRRAVLQPTSCWLDAASRDTSLHYPRAPAAACIAAAAPPPRPARSPPCPLLPAAPEAPAAAAATSSKPDPSYSGAAETYAVVEIGGHQLIVEEGRWYTVNRLEVGGRRGRGTQGGCDAAA